MVNSGSSLATGKAMASSIIPISGKTGTAETYATDGSGNSVTTVNLNAVAYATAKDGTKLAVGIMYPHALDWKSQGPPKCGQSYHGTLSKYSLNI